MVEIEQNRVSTTIPPFEELTVQRATNVSTAKPSFWKTAAKPPLEVSTSKPTLEVQTAKLLLETSTTELTKDVLTQTPGTAELFSTPEGSVTPDWQHVKTHTDGPYEISVSGEITTIAERSSAWRPYTRDNELPLEFTRAVKDCHPPDRAQRFPKSHNRKPNFLNSTTGHRTGTVKKNRFESESQPFSFY
ncbi:unnamed protein product [Rotaria socialis]